MRFCARVDALFFGAGRPARAAGFRGAARRAAGLAVFFAAPLLLAAGGAAARGRVRASPLAPLRAAAAGRGAAGLGAATAAGRVFGSGTAVFWTSVNRG